MTKAPAKSLEETAKQIAKGEAEVDRFRPYRARNYAVKRLAGFVCEACGAEQGLWVCDVDAGVLEARCRDHIEGAVTPGQRTVA